jgi:D-alanyl-lipoteichoic acid acyltransferase DltB (MBOAT superfamily)
MLFNSHEFIFVFVPLVAAVFFFLGARDRRLALAWLLAASLAFYGWWNPRFVLLLAASTIANHLLGRAILASANTPAGRRLLIFALALDLSVLGLFKYANFFIATLDAAAGLSWGALDIILPVGISFYTFTQIAFLVDAYRGRAHAYGFAGYFLFVTYFPHLIAGPILHHREIIPQIEDPATYRPRAAAFAAGLTLFAIGLAKKVLLADPLGETANAVFDAAQHGVRPHLLAAWAGALAYTFQLYFDFSGYCDMAIGVSLLFNIRLPLNFDSPYKAASIVEFWRRWHMTLSRFLRDYLYVPLGGNRRGEGRRRINVMLTMLLGGLWHGAAWTFVAWGALHGTYLVINHAWRESGRRMPRLLALPLTFLAVVCAWVLFRSADFSSALAVLRGMAGINGISLPASFAGMLGAPAGVAFNGALAGFSVDGGVARVSALLLAAAALAWFAPNSQRIARYDADRLVPLALPSLRLAPAMGALLAVAVMALGGVSTFLYYQF